MWLLIVSSSSVTSRSGGVVVAGWCEVKVGPGTWNLALGRNWKAGVGVRIAEGAGDDSGIAAVPSTPYICLGVASEP
jgi:hypothetical protein